MSAATDAAAMRVGWCPGALRPMLSGDGLLVRVKPRGGRLGIDQARELAVLARRFGNGLFDITARGNLQMRGVQADGLDDLVSTLAALRLLDPTPEGEAVRNVVASPLAGHDSTTILDLRAAVDALETRLVTDEALWRLPGKFCWVVDEGGALPLDGVPADIRFEAVSRQGGVSVRIRLAGAPIIAAEISPDATEAAAARLAAAFLALSDAHAPDARRMADLIATCGAGPLFEAAGLEAVSAAPIDPERPCPVPIGLHLDGRSGWVGVAPAFGRLDAAALDLFAGAVASAGGAFIGLTPWRSVLAPGLAREAAEALWHELLASGSIADLILDATDPRLAVAACPGAPACHRATTPVRDDAARLAGFVARTRHDGIALHVSGCAKGCAHPGSAPVTLVGHDGLYDLIYDGRPGDAPAGTGLDIEAVAAILAGSRLSFDRPT